MPARDNPRSTHLSGRDAWRIKLSIQASRKNTNMTSHADIQYLVRVCLIMNVRHIQEMVHNRALKIKGGSKKINWKRVNTMTAADKAGYLITNSICISWLSMFCVPNFFFRLVRKTATTTKNSSNRMSLPL